MPTRLLFALVLAALLSGCATYRNSSQVEGGPGLEFQATELAAFSQNQAQVLARLQALAGLAGAPQGSEWDLVIDAGIDFADSKCEAYLHALFRLNRDRKTVTTQLGLLATATAGLMGAAKSAANEVAGVAVLFGLATSTVDNLAGNLLYDLDPSSVRTLVKALQAGFRNARQPGYKTRTAALRVIRGYAMLCVPSNIEAEVNLAVKRAAPTTAEGDPPTGKPPEASNADLVQTPETAVFDANSELLQKFVRPDGTSFNKANLGQLQDFIRSKGLVASPTSFIRQAQHAAARADAVAHLKLK